MKVQAYAEAAFVGIGGACAVPLYELLAPHLGRALSLLLAGVTAVLVARTLEVVLVDLPRRAAFLRRLVHPMGKFEGRWALLNAFPDQPYACGMVLYDKRSNSYRYEGFGFDATGQKLLDWRTTALVLHDRQNELHYLFSARPHGTGDTQFSGHGVLTFWDNGRGGFDEGTDFWVEDRNGGLRRSTSPIRRLTDQQLQQALGHTEIRGHEDLIKLASEVLEPWR